MRFTHKVLLRSTICFVVLISPNKQSQTARKNRHRDNRVAHTGTKCLLFRFFIYPLLIANCRAIQASPNATIVPNIMQIPRHLLAVEHTSSDKTMTKMFKYDAQGKERESFDAIAGSVHSSRVAFMLKDHHNELGNLKIKAFHVYLPENPAGGGKYNIVIEFGH